MLTDSANNEPIPVAALVVSFMPHIAALDTLLSSLLTEVQLVVLLDNGGASGFLASGGVNRERIRYVDMAGNKGLGAALNKGMEIARADGLRYVITFDQDSAPLPGMVGRLLEALKDKQLSGVPCAAVGPRFYDLREGTERCFPVYREIDGRIRSLSPEHVGEISEVDVLITSGMLIDSDVWYHGLSYDEKLFVDYTDTDWCFRVRDAGWRLYVLSDLKMPHALSDAAPVRLCGVHLLKYSPVRRYYYFRNTVYFLRKSYVSPAWRLRLFIGLIARATLNPIIDHKGWLGVAMSAKGVWHALRGRMGCISND